MRPLALKVDGLTCFREPAVIDFTGLGVVAIAGPTGAGKSSLLDAMILALYGVVPRMGGKGVPELIAHGRTALSVTFDFALGARRFRVARTVKAKGAGVAILSELVGETESKLTSGIDEVKRAVRDLIGIDAAAFQQAVILPQGEFQQFLKSAPADRRKTLNALLGIRVYEEMRRRADDLAKARKLELEALARDLEGKWAAVTPAAVRTIDKELSEVTARRPELEAAQAALGRDLARLREEARLTAELGALAARLGALAAAQGAIDEREAALQVARSVAPVLPLIDAVERAGVVSARARKERDEVEARRAASERAEVEARAAVDAARVGAEAIGAWREAIAALDRSQGDFERRALLRKTRAGRVASDGAVVAFDAVLLERARALAPTGALLAAQRKSAAAAHAALADERRTAERRRTKQAEAERRRRDLEVAEAQAEAAWRAADHEHRAAGLREDLAIGAPCPVCAQVVHARPDALAVPGLEAARAAREAARNAGDGGRAAAQKAQLEADASERLVDERQDALDRMDAEVARLEALLGEVPGGLGGADAPVEARLAAWQEALEAAELAALEARLAAFEGLDPKAERRALEGRIAAAEAALRAAEDAHGRARLARAEVAAAALARGEAVAAAERAEVEARAARDAALEPLGFGPEAARAVALEAAVIERYEREVRAHAQELVGKTARRGEVLAALGGARASDADVARVEALAAAAQQAVTEAVQREATLGERVQHLKRELVAAEAARARRESAKIEYDIHQRLAEDLKSNALQAYVLEEVLADLVRGASARLRALSGERYGLLADDKSSFLVVDHDNAGEKRSTDTLSGGETFLASLALALELSEQIQQKAGKVHLESLFIDEGFGTLDPETLDVVATAIEGLGATGRLVGLITHVAELSARLPHKIRVERGPAGAGSRVTVETGA